MAGTKTGGKKAARTTKQRYGKDFYRIAGRKGGNPILLKKESK